MLNLTAFFEELDNDTESIQMILGLYLEEYPDCHVKIRNLFEEQNWAELFPLAHSLKGILKGFGEDVVVPSLEIIESETHGGNPASPEHIDRVCSELPKIQTEIEQKLASLS
jgi:HPt (histidine-containing phosphotransfer) domain-containing protein